MDFPKSVPGVGLVGGKFVDENAGTGQQGSLIPSAWGNSVTEELLNLIRAAGVEPDETLQNQIAQILWTDPTETKRGMPLLASLAEAQLGADSKKVLSSASVASVFGLGQSLASFFGSRLSGVAYTNTTKRPIWVQVRAFAPPGGGSCQIVLTADGAESSSSYATTGNGVSVGSIVMPGKVYVVTVVNASITHWMEAR